LVHRNGRPLGRMRLGRHIVVVDRSVVRFRQHQHHGHHEVDSLDMDSLHPKWRTESPMAAEIPNQIEHENIREGKDRRFAPDSLLLAPCADDALDSKIGEDDNYSILSKYWNNALVAEEVALVAVAEEGEEEDMRVLSCPQYARNRRWSHYGELAVATAGRGRASAVAVGVATAVAAHSFHSNHAAGRCDDSP